MSTGQITRVGVTFGGLLQNSKSYGEGHCSTSLDNEFGGCEVERSSRAHRRKRACAAARTSADNCIRKQMRKISLLETELSRLRQLLQDPRLEPIAAVLPYVDAEQRAPPGLLLRRNVASHVPRSRYAGRDLVTMGSRDLNRLQKGADLSSGLPLVCFEPLDVASAQWSTPALEYPDDTDIKWSEDDGDRAHFPVDGCCTDHWFIGDSSSSDDDTSDPALLEGVKSDCEEQEEEICRLRSQLEAAAGELVTLTLDLSTARSLSAAHSAEIVKLKEQKATYEAQVEALRVELDDALLTVERLQVIAIDSARMYATERRRSECSLSAAVQDKELLETKCEAAQLSFAAAQRQRDAALERVQYLEDDIIDEFCAKIAASADAPDSALASKTGDADKGGTKRTLSTRSNVISIARALAATDSLRSFDQNSTEPTPGGPQTRISGQNSDSQSGGPQDRISEQNSDSKVNEPVHGDNDSFRVVPGFLPPPVFGDAICLEMLVPTMCGKTITLHVATSDAISRVKGLIEQEEGLGYDAQCLFVAGKQLENDRTIYSYMMQRVPTLHLVLRMRSGNAPLPVDLLKKNEKHVKDSAQSESVAMDINKNMWEPKVDHLRLGNVQKNAQDSCLKDHAGFEASSSSDAQIMKQAPVIVEEVIQHESPRDRFSSEKQSDVGFVKDSTFPKFFIISQLL